jgi:hypothetical protein
MRPKTSRKYRAAAATFAMLIVTPISITYVYYGHLAVGLAYESLSIIVYAIWIFLGKKSE